MSREAIFVWLLVLALVFAMALTIILTPGRTRHGYGALEIPVSPRTGISPGPDPDTA